jgi:hypothetical protein
MHFLLNHSFEFLESDLTAYFCINEAMESKNKVTNDKNTNGKCGESELNNLVLQISEQNERLSEEFRQRRSVPIEKLNPPTLERIIETAEPTPWVEKFSFLD